MIEIPNYHLALAVPELLNQEPDRICCASVSDATVLLNAVEQGQSNAADELLELVYEELRRLAAFKMAQQPLAHTLQPTALVHEAWLKLVGPADKSFKNRAHFFSAAAEAMRHILIDSARRKQTKRHGGAFERVAIDEIQLVSPLPDEQLLALNEALERFSRQFPTQAEVVKLRYFVGMSNEETAELMDISISTVKNYWNFSRAWLFKEIHSA